MKADDMDQDIDLVSKMIYAGGGDPIDHAVFLVRIRIDLRDRLAANAQAGRPVNQRLASRVHSEGWSREILGSLLAAGWTPPAIPGQPTIDSEIEAL